VANNVAGFCKEVCVVSHLGMIDPHDDFFRAALLDNVRLEGVPAPKRPTIIKRRFVESYLLQKLFETYQIDDEPLSVEEERPLLEKLKSLLPNFDLVIVADYGHGMLNRAVRDVICTHSRYLAVNTQANAGNNGFHTISAYPRADYISISFSELCLEMRKRYGELEEMLSILRERIECDQITVTKGKHGIFVWTKERGFTYAPAMTQHFVDRVGSGDAVLAVTSPLSALKVDPELIAFLGNLAGAEAVRTVGHRSFLTRARLIKIVKSLLK
jgi:bifunctional ADP-heptose synthase (sugar kinase/adenylyltransferase)